MRYSNCNLTFDSDMLVPFSGVARGMCRQMKLEPNDYVAGLWKPTLVWELLWKVRWKERTPRPMKRTISSWSWASVDGVVGI